MSVAARLAEVRARIDAAARASGRDPAHVKLVAVSKRQPLEAIAEAYAAGQRAFGENYAQEFSSKARALTHLAEIEWHFVGHLQTNKVNLLADCHAIHSVDSVHVAAAIEKRRTGRPMRAFVELNLSGEPSKAGCTEAAAPAIVDYLRGTTHVTFAGLMTMPPTGDLIRAGTIFGRLAEVAQAVSSVGERVELSMGMSQDYEVAVEEGATFVRIGTAIFGMRPG